MPRGRVLDSHLLGHYLGRLEKERTEYAVRSLETPGEDRSSFAFGKHSGFMQGLRRAEQLLNEMLEEPEEDERE